MSGDIKQFQKCKNLNNVPFLCTKLFQKRGHHSREDIIQGGHYLRKYGISNANQSVTKIHLEQIKTNERFVKVFS